MPSPTMRAATASDLPAIERLLQTLALPPDGLLDFYPHGYVVAIAPDGELVGVAGVEVHGDQGLLRSVAVSPAVQGRGIGATLAHDRLAWAATAGLVGVHLLTTTASPYFARLGFVVVERDTLPASIRASVEFTKACPQTAVAMSLVPVTGRSGDQPNHSTGTGV